MIHKIFTVYDSKAELFMQPFFMPTTGQALRSFEDTCNDSSTLFAKHPADFTLFEIGSYEDITCEIRINDSKVNLGTALEYVQTNNEVTELRSAKNA